MSKAKLLFLPLILVFTFANLVSCACGSPEKRNTPACVAKDAVIDCTKKEIMEAIPKAYDLIAFILSSGAPNADALLEGAETMSLQIVACTAQVVMEDLAKQQSDTPSPGEFSSKLKLSSGDAETARSRFEAWKKVKFGGNVNIKTK